MLRASVLCALLAGGVALAAPVPFVPPNQAPPPRLVKPDISLVVSEMLPDKSALRARVYRIGFRNGRALPPETATARSTSASSVLASNGFVR